MNRTLRSILGLVLGIALALILPYGLLESYRGFIPGMLGVAVIFGVPIASSIITGFVSLDWKLSLASALTAGLVCQPLVYVYRTSRILSIPLFTAISSSYSSEIGQFILVSMVAGAVGVVATRMLRRQLVHVPARI